MPALESFFVLLAIGGVACALLFQIIIIPLFTMRTVVVTITGKEMVVRGKVSVCMVYTEDEIFENTNSFLPSKFDSLELQQKLQINGTYRLCVCGVRNRVCSWFRNIISAELIEAHHWSFQPSPPSVILGRTTRR